MSQQVRLGELQLAIMRVLWSRAEASVADVQTALAPARTLATTTVATMLKKMEHKGVVAHRAEGRRFLYRPTVGEGEVTRSMVAHLRDQLFGGDSAALVSHLIEEGALSRQELAQLQQLVADAAAEEGSP